MLVSSQVEIPNKGDKEKEYDNLDGFYYSK